MWQIMLINFLWIGTVLAQEKDQKKNFSKFFPKVDYFDKSILGQTFDFFPEHFDFLPK